jgi:hypothetical protein
MILENLQRDQVGKGRKEDLLISRESYHPNNPLPTQYAESTPATTRRVTPCEGDMRILRYQAGSLAPIGKGDPLRFRRFRV